MKNRIFVCLFYCIATAQASFMTPVQASITIAQILATPRLPLFINPKQKYILTELIFDLVNGMEPFSNCNQYPTEPTINWIKSIIEFGFKPHENTISEQALVAVMSFIFSINKDQKTIQTIFTDKIYPVGYSYIWKAILDHFFFAQLIVDKKIACWKVNDSPVYHPNNFHSREMPSIISGIARTYGPYFQDMSLKERIPGFSLMLYAQTSRDPRANSGDKTLVFYTFPELCLNQIRNIS